MNTLFFEETYNVDIKDFDTTKDVDKFIEEKIGRKLKVKRIDTNLI